MRFVTDSPDSLRSARVRRSLRGATLLLIALGGAWMGACGEPAPTQPDPDPDPVPVASVSVTPDGVTIEVGETQAFTAQTLATGGVVLTGRAVTWSTADASIATVDASGVVTAIAPGSTTVTATSEGVDGSAVVIVMEVPVAEVVVSPDSVTLDVGDTLTVSAEMRDAGGAVLTGREVTWASTDSTVATVDSTGLVTAVSEGDALVIATSGSVADTASITVVDNSVPAGFTKVWRTGAVDTDWSNGANWTPPGPPTASDTVLIQAAANQPTVGETVSMASLTVAAGAEVTLTGQTMNVSGNVDAGGDGVVGGTVQLTGTGTMTGTLSTLVISGARTLSGTTAASGNVTVNGSGSLTIGVETMTVAGFFETQSSGTLVMTDAAGELDVAGRALFRGGVTEGLLTAGTLRVGGDFDQQIGGVFGAFQASGAHLVVLDGTGPQEIDFAAAGLAASSSRVANLEIAGGDVTVVTLVTMVGDVSVTSASSVTGPGTLEFLGDLTTVAGSDVSPTRVEIGGAMSVAGTFSPATTEFTGSSQTIQAGLAYQAVVVSGTASLGGSTAASGNVIVNGSGSLTIGAETLTVAGFFETQSSGTLVMADAAGELDVSGRALFRGGVTEGLLTAGTLRVGGDFDQWIGGVFGAFQASGTHLVVLDGAGPQTIDFASAGMGSSSSRVANLEIAGGDVTVATVVTMLGDVSVTSASSVTGTGTLEFLGDLTTVAGSDVSPTRVEIGGAMSVAGTFSPATTEFTGSSQTIQAGLGYQALVVSGTASLVGTTAASANVIVNGSGSLAIGAETLTVAGFFETQASGTLEMTDAAGELDVAGRALFRGGVTEGLLTAGTLRVGGDFDQQIGGVFGAFQASGAHLVVLDGTGPQEIDFAAAGLAASSSRVANLEIAGGDVTVATLVTMVGDVSVTSASSVTGTGTLEFLGDLTTVAGSDVSPTRVEIGGAMSVAGTFSPATTEFTGSGQTVQAGLAYQAVVVSGTASLGGTTAASGNVIVNGSGRLTIGAETMTVGGFFETQGSGTLEMTGAAGELDVAGRALFRGGVTEGLLTAGTLRVGGDFDQWIGGVFGAFQASGAHLVVLDGAGPQEIEFAAAGLAASLSRIANLEIAGGDVTVATLVTMVGDVSVTAASSVTGTGTLEFLGDLTTVAGSDVSPTRVEIGGAMSVAGTFSPATTEFTGSSQTIQAGLDYQAVVVSGTASLGGTTAASGNVIVNGSGRLTIGAETMTVAGFFETQGSGALEMTDGAGELDVAGRALFRGGVTEGLLTAGTLRVGGDFDQQIGGVFGAFQASGTHLVVLDGTGPQTIDFASAGSGASSSRIANLEVAGADVTVTSDIRITGDAVLTGSMTLDATFTVEILIDLTLESGSALVNNGTINVTGTCTDNGSTVTGTGTGNVACVIP